MKKITIIPLRAICILLIAGIAFSAQAQSLNLNKNGQTIESTVTNNVNIVRENHSDLGEGNSDGDMILIPGGPPGGGDPPGGGELIVDAGEDQTATLGDTITLTGTLSYEGGVPVGTTTTWTKISGPGDVTFADPSALSTTATFSIDGTYDLQLEAINVDEELSDQDTVQIIMNPAGGPPGGGDPPGGGELIVGAGEDQTATLGDTITLTGTLSYEGGVPVGTTTTWTKISGPGDVTFADPSALSTTATFSIDGTYDLQLEAINVDEELSDQDTVQIIMNPAGGPPGGGDPPGGGELIVDAGEDQTATLGDTITLTGTLTYEGGVPVGTTTIWTKISGPGDVTFADPSALSTTATFSIDGTYDLQLEAINVDEELFDQDTVQIIMNPAGGPPGGGDPPGGGELIVDAGEDQTATLGDTITLTGTLTYEGGVPVGTTTIWTKISGPGDVTFADPSALSTTATFSIDGTYDLQLEAINVDEELSDQDTVQIIMNPAGGPPGGGDPPGGGELIVDAGEDQNGTLCDTIYLSGILSIEGGVPVGTTTTWTKISGPGNVTFADPSALSTTATFSINGIYDLQLEAMSDDGELSNQDTVQIVLDIELPVVITQDIEITLEDCSGSVTVDDIDNGSYAYCGIQSRSLDITEFTCDDIGNRTVTLTVTDNNGNFSTGTAIVTVNAGLSYDMTVELRDSYGDFLSGGVLKYKDQGWHLATEVSPGLFGFDTDKENIKLKMRYAGAIQVEKHVPVSSGFTYQTTEVTAELRQADGTLGLDGGKVKRKFKNKNWVLFGFTGDDGLGIVLKEMLPVSYRFKIKYQGDKQKINNHNVAVNPIVTFSENNLKMSSAVIEEEEVEELPLIAYPNPFSKETNIEFNVPETQPTSLIVYNAQGKVVATLYKGIAEADKAYKVTLNGSRLPAGLYFYHLQSGSTVNTVKKLLLIR